MLTDHKVRCCIVAVLVAFAALVAVPASGRRHLRAQNSESRTLQPDVPQWQIDAGGSAKFDVASVKQSGSNIDSHANVETSANSSFVPTGGLYSVNVNLHMFITFAYKLYNYGWYSVASQLPKWANETNYDIEARAPGNPTKDQYRLMMQALMAERFKLVVHWEMKEMPVTAVMLEKPGKLGRSFDDIPTTFPAPLNWRSMVKPPLPSQLSQAASLSVAACRAGSTLDAGIWPDATYP
jgi:hypothetical protein